MEWEEYERFGNAAISARLGLPQSVPATDGNILVSVIKRDGCRRWLYPRPPRPGEDEGED